MVAGGRRVAGRRIYANPREIWNLERLARHRAAKLGYRVRRSRRRKGRDNAGEFMLIHKAGELDRPIPIRLPVGHFLISVRTFSLLRVKAIRITRAHSTSP